MIGISGESCNLVVHISNKPPLEQYEQLKTVRPFDNDEAANIISLTGNHWRKVFSIYAKLLVGVYPAIKSQQATWQAYRDGPLLTAGCVGGLDWSADFSNKQVIHIVTGFTYGLACFEQESWFAVTEKIWRHKEKENVLCVPYFDYRQLPNVLLEEVITLVKSMHEKVHEETQ